MKNLREYWGCAEIEKMNDVYEVLPMNGFREVVWGQPMTHIRVVGEARRLQEVTEPLNLLVVPRSKTDQDVIVNNPADWVAHVLAVSYDSTKSWCDNEIGTQLAYLSMSMLQVCEGASLCLTGVDDPFSVFLSERFSAQHPLWRHVSFISERNKLL